MSMKQIGIESCKRHLQTEAHQPIYPFNLQKRIVLGCALPLYPLQMLHKFALKKVKFRTVESAEKIKSQFSKALRGALVAHYGKLPAASVLSREFNLRARGVDSISQESARRWLRGLSMPTQDKLGILQAWLSLDLNIILCAQGGLENGLSAAHVRRSRDKRLDPMLSKEPSDDGGFSKSLLQMLDRLSNSERIFMMDIVGLLASRTISESASPPKAAASAHPPKLPPGESPPG